MLGANGICVPKQRVISLDRTLSGKEVKFNTQASIHTIYLGFEEKDILVGDYFWFNSVFIKTK